jgi:hypothetical protein
MEDQIGRPRLRVDANDLVIEQIANRVSVVTGKPA